MTITIAELDEDCVGLHDEAPRQELRRSRDACLTIKES